MKWGVRRYQNPDGTLTDLGRKRHLGNSKAKIKDTISAESKKADTATTSEQYISSMKKVAREYGKLAKLHYKEGDFFAGDDASEFRDIIMMEIEEIKHLGK